MHGRKLVTVGTVATLAILALAAGCGEATTGPTSVKPQDFASALKLLSGNVQTGSVGAALPEVLSVKVVDAGGQPVTGATVLWQVRAGGGTVNPPASTSSISGLATVTWTLGSTLGANKVVAILQGNYVLDSVSFTATATVGPANKFTIVSGDAQSGRVASVLGTPLTVNVKDQFGYPVAGAHVAWSAGNFSGAVAAVADTTDASGNASANWTLGTQVTNMTATATVTGLAPLAFVATATPDTSRVLSLALGSGQTGPTGAALSTPISMRVIDRFGNAIASDTVTFTDSTVGGGTFSKQTAVTDVTGLASTIWTLGPRVGTQSMRARLGSRPTTASATAVATVQFSDIAVGNFHVCALATSSKVYCWGQNDAGQLGRGNFKATSSPTTPVATTADSSADAQAMYARQVTGSRSSVCVVTLAQDVYCWGHQWGTLTTSPLPAQQIIKANGGSGSPLSLYYLQVAEDHACLIQVSGVSNCTGNNDIGQLGDASAGPPFTSPGSGSWPYVDTKAPYSNLQLGTSFSCGFHRYNSEARTGPPVVPDSSQIPLCWGDGASGQRGDSTTLNLALQAASTPKHVKVTGNPFGGIIAFDSSSLAVGDKHACAVIAATSPVGTPGVAYCWGLNAHGQLGRATAGTGNTARDSSAAPVAGAIAFARLFAGKYHTCGLTAGGVAYCWGRNDYGQLGNGSRTTFNTGSTTVTPVATGLTFRNLSLGELSTCGVTGAPTSAIMGPSATPGTVYCWGDNSFGQVGNGQTSTASSPVLTPTKVFGQP